MQPALLKREAGHLQIEDVCALHAWVEDLRRAQIVRFRPASKKCLHLMISFFIYGNGALLCYRSAAYDGPNKQDCKAPAL